jgi:uncharacterized protein YndB with AHSA1/START domain
MARNEAFIAAPVKDVFAFLAEPATYADWVVGSREIVSADEGWPAAGSEFEHVVGVPPLVIQDRTKVVAASPPSRLVLHARARPLPSARITFHLLPEGDGTRVTMIEDFENGLVNLVTRPLGHAAVRLRNRETLRRLKRLAEGELVRAA